MATIEFPDYFWRWRVQLADAPLAAPLTDKPPSQTTPRQRRRHKRRAADPQLRRAAERIKHSSTCVLRDRCRPLPRPPIFILWICQNHRSSIGIIGSVASYWASYVSLNRVSSNSFENSDRWSSWAILVTHESPGESGPAVNMPSSAPPSSWSKRLNARSAAFSSRQVARLLTLRSPCMVAFCLDLALPADVLGPVLCSHGLFLSAVARREFNPFRDRR